MSRLTFGVVGLASLLMAGSSAWAGQPESPVPEASGPAAEKKPMPRAVTSENDPFSALLTGVQLKPVKGTVTGLSREEGVEARAWSFGVSRVISRWQAVREGDELSGALEFRSGLQASASIALADDGLELFVDRLTSVRVSRVPASEAADAPTSLLIELRRGKIVIVPMPVGKKAPEAVTVVTPSGEMKVMGITEVTIGAEGAQQRAVAAPAPLPRTPPKPILRPKAAEPEKLEAPEAGEGTSTGG